MAYNPEFDQNKISVMEAGRCLLGALIRTQLRNAIAKAEDERDPIDPEIKDRLKGYFAYLDRKTHVLKARRLFLSAWEQEKEKSLREEIIVPLYQIYTKIEGQEPDPSKPWLGELLMDVALDKEGTEEVRLHLAKFGLDPKTLVWEVYQYLDRKLEKG